MKKTKEKKEKKRPQFNIWLEATTKFGPALICIDRMQACDVYDYLYW